MGFDGLMSAGTFAEVGEIPEGCNIVEREVVVRVKRGVGQEAVSEWGHGAPPYHDGPRTMISSWLTSHHPCSLHDPPPGGQTKVDFGVQLQPPRPGGVVV